MTDKSKSIPPSTVIIPFVTFPGQEIKDLYVHESNTAPPAAPAATAAPPAAAARNNERKPASNNRNNNNAAAAQSAPRAPRENNNNNRGGRQQETKPAESLPQQPRLERDSIKSGGASSTPAEQAGTGGHLLKMRERKSAPGAPLPVATPVETSKEFNFEEGLNSFKKEEVLAAVAGNEEAKLTKYVKDDFFDNLTGGGGGGSVPAGGDAPRRGRLTAAEERQLNTDTFGAIALQSGYRRGGRGRGRGGGGNAGGNNNGGGRNNNRYRGRPRGGAGGVTAADA